MNTNWSAFDPTDYRYQRQNLPLKQILKDLSERKIRHVGTVIIWYGSGSSILGWVPIRIRIQSGSRVLMNKNWIFLDQKLQLTYPLWRLSYKISLQISKNIQGFKTWNFLIFLLLWVILNPDPKPAIYKSWQWWSVHLYGTGGSDGIRLGGYCGHAVPLILFHHK